MTSYPSKMMPKNELGLFGLDMTVGFNMAGAYTSMYQAGSVCPVGHGWVGD